MHVLSMVKSLAAAVLLAGLSTGVLAQNTTGTSGAPQPTPSHEMLMGALNGGAAGMALLGNYFDGNIGPQDLVKRVGLMLQTLRDQMGTYDPETLAQALDRIVNTALASLHAAHIVKLDVDPNSVPDRPRVVLDFGPGDTPGVQRIKFKVPDNDPGPYRILIPINEIPGQQMSVNGSVIQVHDVTVPDGPQDAALVFLAYAVDGEIEFELPASVPPSSINLVFERADAPSRYILAADMLDELVPLDVQLAIEAEIQALAAAMLEEILPAAGPPQSNLPEPTFQPEETASPS